jgi:hypothetical protein
MIATAVKEKYAPFIAALIEQIPAGTPIFTFEIVKKMAEEFNIELKRAKTIVNTNLNRLKENGVIENYRRGIYYKPKNTAFGKSHLNPNQVITKMFVKPNNEEVVGYETGASLIHRLGLTTQMPKYKFIATNTTQPRVIDDLQVVIRKPHLKVTKENYIYLQVLDIIENKDGVVLDIPEPLKAINTIIEKNKLDFAKLCGIATTYTEKVVVNLAKIAYATRL